MIYDRFENLHLYCQPGTRLHRALVHARDVARSVADGRMDIDGDRLYASVATYETGPREDRRFEAHRMAWVSMDGRMVQSGMRVPLRMRRAAYTPRPWIFERLTTYSGLLSALVGFDVFCAWRMCA